MSPRAHSIFPLVALLGAACLSTNTANAQTPAEVQAPEGGHKPTTWPHTFPLLGQGAATRGIKMPLPYGIGLNYAFANQGIEISRIAVGVNGSEPVDLSDTIKFGDMTSQIHALNARLDMWILPFLNVYVMGNYIIESTTSVTVVEPFTINAGAVQPGAGAGFGGTFATGVWGFFATVDVNWTWNKMEKLNDPVGTFLLTPRVGRNLGKALGVEWIFWVGGMRQRIQSETKGDIHLSEALGGAGNMDGFEEQLVNWYNGLPPSRQAIARGIAGRLEGATGDPVIHYELDKAIASPWNALIGTEIGISPALRLRAEFGFINRTQLVLGFCYRFGDFGADPSEEDE